MRRPINWLVVVISAVFLITGISLPGCGGSSDQGMDGDPDPGNPPVVNGMLRTVRNADELEATLKSALAEVVADGVPAGALQLPSVTAANYSGTYTVEQGVDELDFARYDGTHLYLAPQYTGTPQESAAIRILRTDPGSATATEVGSIPLDPAQSVQGMYVANGRLLLVTSEAYFGPYGGNWLTILIWAPTRFSVHVHDVRDPAHPRPLMSATIDGVFVASRRIDDRIVLVSRHAPRALLNASQRQNLAQLSLAELLPTITIDGQKESLVDPRRCYIANDERRGDHAVLTTISTFSLANPHDIGGVCYDEPADGVYASREALYVSEPRFGAGFATSTRIHKFSLSGASASYAGSVEVPGALWMGGQQDFRMNESDGLLRVVTTESTGDMTDSADHRLFVLRQKSGEHALEIIGRLPNDVRPQEIGKPNESLYAVRFDGDRAYAVTFRRIDPLYVFDLSTPADPRIAGELLIPGVSEFLHPVTQDLLLGLGLDGSQFKLELYDTSVLQSPQSRGAITLGGTYSDSIARYDRHAFAYLAGTPMDRFAIPAVIATGQPGINFGVDQSLRQFEILGKETAASASLREAGSISPPDPSPSSAGSQRAFIHGDTVFYVRDGRVWGAFWSAPSQVNGPF